MAPGGENLLLCRGAYFEFLLCTVMVDTVVANGPWEADIHVFFIYTDLSLLALGKGVVLPVPHFAIVETETAKGEASCPQTCSRALSPGWSDT